MHIYNNKFLLRFIKEYVKKDVVSWIEHIDCFYINSFHITHTLQDNSRGLQDILCTEHLKILEPNYSLLAIYTHQ